MARANRHYVPSLIWHITHRCHKKEFFSRDGHLRDGKWSESVAVGTKFFVEKMKERLGIRALGRQVVKTSDVYELKEPASSYASVFDSKKEPLSSKNRFSWRILDSNSIT